MLFRLYAARGKKIFASIDPRVSSLAVLACIGALLLTDPGRAWRPVYVFIAVSAVIPVIIYVAIHLECTGFLRSCYTFLGAISFAVYSIQGPIVQVIENSLSRFSAVPIEVWAPWPGIALVAIVVPLAWILHRHFDEPLRRSILTSTIPFPTVPSRPDASSRAAVDTTERRQHPSR